MSQTKRSGWDTLSTPPDTWEFGWQINTGGKPHMPESPYHLNLNEHSGIVVGQTEEGLLMSLHQLAYLAASHGWNVVLFDPQPSETHAAAFVSTVQAAGCSKIYQFPDKMRLSNQEARSYLLRSYLTRMLVDHTTVSAASIGVPSFRQPTESRTFAQLLLGDIMRSIQQQDARMLLLLKHPELLFEPEQILPLFAALEQARWSVFVAAKSIADFGENGQVLVENARTVIVHRSNPSSHLGFCISPFFDETVRALPDNECFVLHAGEATHVRAKSVEALVSEDDEEAFFSDLFGPGKHTSSDAFEQHDALRSAADRAHLRRALLMLDEGKEA